MLGGNLGSLLYGDVSVMSRNVGLACLTNGLCMHMRRVININKITHGDVSVMKSCSLG